MDCLFCKINEGTIPSKTLYENEYTKVIMDINPSSNGHILILPKKHFTDFLEMDNEYLGYINDTAKIMKAYLYEALNPDGLILTVNYGLTQAINHYHLHLIPVYKKRQPINDIDTVYTKIKNVM